MKSTRKNFLAVIIIAISIGGISYVYNLKKDNK